MRCWAWRSLCGGKPFRICRVLKCSWRNAPTNNMKNEIPNHTEALIWALALAHSANTKADYIRAMQSADHFAAFHFESEVEEAKKRAVLLAAQWNHEAICLAIQGARIEIQLR